MVPGEPGQARPIGVEARRGVKVISGDKDLAAPTTFQVKADQGVDRLASVHSVILAHADHAAPAVINHAVRISQVLLRSERLRLGTDLLAIEALIHKVREVNRAVPDGKRCASILVYARARVKGGGGHVHSVPIRRPTHDRIPPALHWAALKPVDIIAIERDFQQPHRPRGDQV